MPEISTCVSGSYTAQFIDTFPDSSSLSNYTFYPVLSGVPSTSTALGYSAAGGELQDTPAQSYVALNGAQFPYNLGDYTVEADFKMDTRSSNTGLFGLTFLEQADETGYAFQWNGNPENATPYWQIQKDTGSSGAVSTYLPPSGYGTGAATAYTPGDWVHLKVVVMGGTTFYCYVNLYDGNGDQLVYNLTDTLGSPFTTGGAGFREVMASPNLLHIRNFHVFACGPTPTPVFCCANGGSLVSRVAGMGVTGYTGDGGRPHRPLSTNPWVFWRTPMGMFSFATHRITWSVRFPLPESSRPSRETGPRDIQGTAGQPFPPGCIFQRI